jgi:hypothetical protein
MCTAPSRSTDQYDTDVTTWSPQGRLFQVEYAMEAVKQGSACVGLVSKTHAVVVGLKRCVAELKKSHALPLPHVSRTSLPHVFYIFQIPL